MALNDCPPPCVCPPDLSVTPMAYTLSEGHKWQPWDNPKDPRSILWEDGRRWDCVNGYTEGPSTQAVADIKEGMLGGYWLCKTHGTRTDYVHNGKRTCSPAADYDLSKCECVKE